MRLFLGDQSVVITKEFIFALRRRTCVCIVSGSSGNSVFEVRPRRASELAVCSCGNKRGTRESQSL